MAAFRDSAAATCGRIRVHPCPALLGAVSAHVWDGGVSVEAAIRVGHTNVVDETRSARSDAATPPHTTRREAFRPAMVWASKSVLYAYGLAETGTRAPPTDTCLGLTRGL